MTSSTLTTSAINPKIARFLDEQRPETPCLVVDLDVVAAQYRRLADAVPTARIFYAVKANPAPEVLALLAGMGSAFDVASPLEVDLCITAGAAPENLSYGNTIKKRPDITNGYEKGVRVFAFDSIAEL